MEGEFGIRRFITVGEEIRVGIVRVAFFYETFHTDRAEGFRLIGARDPLTAHVAEERLTTAAAGRHDSSSSSIATQSLVYFAFLLSFSNQLKNISLYISGRAQGCWARSKYNK